MNEETNVDCINSTTEKEVHHTCCYCGQEAHYQFKNGKWYCQKNVNLCLEMRKLRSEKSKLAHQKFKAKYGHGRQEKGETLQSNITNQTKYPSRGDHVCVYCGEYAEYQLKDGRWCCKPHNQCPVIKQKFSDIKIGHRHSIVTKQAIRDSIKKRKQRGDYDKHQFKCSFCGKIWQTTKSGYSCHINHCQKNPNGVHWNHLGKHLSDFHKQQISKGMKRAHKEGRAGTWIGLRKRSYAEQSWYDIFFNEFGEGSFVNNFFVKECHYWLDFAWPEKKLYFEVDGKTHYTEQGKQHDVIRTDKLSQVGWTLIGRCNWSEYQKLSRFDKERYVQSVINLIQSF